MLYIVCIKFFRFQHGTTIGTNNAVSELLSLLMKTSRNYWSFGHEKKLFMVYFCLG